jgi:hypothetical protein
MRWRKTVISALGAVLLLAPVAASTQDGAVKIGVLDDMSGPYSDNTDRDRLGRHAEQGRRRRRHRAALVRQRAG